MEGLTTWQNRTLCKMTSTHQEKEIRVTIGFVVIDNNLQFNFAYNFPTFKSAQVS